MTPQSRNRETAADVLFHLLFLACSTLEVTGIGY